VYQTNRISQSRVREAVAAITRYKTKQITGITESDAKNEFGMYQFMSVQYLSALNLSLHLFRSIKLISDSRLGAPLLLYSAPKKLSN
jgi:hypothetical protein